MLFASRHVTMGCFSSLLAIFFRRDTASICLQLLLLLTHPKDDDIRVVCAIKKSNIATQTTISVL